VACEAEPAGVRCPVPVEEEEIGEGSKAGTSRKDRRAFPEGKEPGDVGERNLPLRARRLHDCKRGECKDDDTGKDPVPGIRRIGAGNGTDRGRFDCPCGAAAVPQLLLDRQRL